MSLPFHTTTVTIRRPATANQDPFETATYTTVKTGVPAVIGDVTGAERDVGGSLEALSARLALDPGEDVRSSDVVEDESTGLIWEVSWASEVTGLGLDHVEGGLKLARGGSSG